MSLHRAGHGAYASYATGFILSLVLTFAAYFLVTGHAFSTQTIVIAIVALAIAQLLVQLLFFLHLGAEPRPRWNLMVMLFAVMVLVIVVFGSLWIMSNLNYHMMMSPSETNEYIMEDEGIHR